MKGLKDKVALVSAASSGIGKGIAEILSANGCRVHIFSRNEDRIRESASEISRKTGNTVNYSSGDMTNLSDMERVLKEVKEKTGNVDFLIINYGDPKVAPFLELNDNDWDGSLNMFIKTSILLVKSTIGYMTENSGRIVFVTSLTTKQPMENFAISASLRAAVVSLSKVLSIEFSHTGITSNSISQGFIQTPRLESIAKNNSRKFGISVEEAYDRIKETIPAKRIGKPSEVGELVSFLCSEEASYINGTNIQIDGGVVKFPF